MEKQEVYTNDDTTSSSFGYIHKLTLPAEDQLDQVVFQELAALVKRNKLAAAEQLILPHLLTQEERDAKLKKDNGHIYPKVPPNPKNPYLQKYVELTSTNRHSKRVTQFLEKLYSVKASINGEAPNFHSFLISHFKELETRLAKKGVRYLIGALEWEAVELRLRSDLRLLGLAAEDYFFKGELKVCRRWIELYGLGAKGENGHEKEGAVLEKVEICEWIENGMAIEEDGGAALVPNKVIEEDFFGKQKIITI